MGKIFIAIGKTDKSPSQSTPSHKNTISIFWKSATGSIFMIPVLIPKNSPLPSLC